MAAQPPPPVDGRVSCSMSSVLLRRVRTTLGEEGVSEVLARAGVREPASYFEDIGNWIPYAEQCALFEAAVEVTGDERLARRTGEDVVRQHAGTPVATLFRSLGSPEAVYEQLSIGIGKFTTVTELASERVVAGHATVSAWARPGWSRDRNMCGLMLGMLSQPTVLFGLPPADVGHPECELEGDARCRYEITWDAAEAAETADPEKLVVALEAQLAAMGDRLDNMYATARDLIALRDVDAALDRITHRAATAVRAPSYLLAVRTDEDAEPRIHQRGLSEADAAEQARTLLDGPAERAGGGARIVADIASADRHYGRIMAASPSGAFFAHERDLLEIYGRYAAAVLDMATAYDDAQRQGEQSRALLELSRALAAASESDEVAQRLADAVPAVVDCDRVGVFLWEAEEEVLVCHAITGQGGASELVQNLRIHGSDTPALAGLLAEPNPGPLFFDAGSDDPYVAEIMRQTGAAALIVVPIVAHERFYGTLHVSVTSRPERLQPTAALLDLLAGVVAQTATALDNARLIETMLHQARFDNLTGLLGHLAFHEALESELEHTEGPFSLASIDLDDFKLINDRYGHLAGDSVLKHVSQVIRSCIRDIDHAARYGGEEFAVILPHTSLDGAIRLGERIRQAIAERAIPLPEGGELHVTSSLGVSAVPATATSQIEAIAVADAALYRAKQAGRNLVAQ